MVFVIVHTPRPTSKGLDHPICMSMLYACASLSCSRLFHAQRPLRAWSCLVTFDAHKALFGCDYLGGISGCRVASCVPFPFPQHTMLCLPCLFVPPVGFSMHLYTLAYMFMHKSCLLVCCSYFNTMKLWTSKPNLHLSLADTTFRLLSCLFACFLVSLLAMPIMLICFMPFSYALCTFSLHCFSVGFLSLPLHVHTWSEDAWS